MHEKQYTNEHELHSTAWNTLTDNEKETHKRALELMNQSHAELDAAVDAISEQNAPCSAEERDRAVDAYTVAYVDHNIATANADGIITPEEKESIDHSLAINSIHSIGGLTKGKYGGDPTKTPTAQVLCKHPELANHADDLLGDEQGISLSAFVKGTSEKLANLEQSATNHIHGTIDSVKQKSIELRERVNKWHSFKMGEKAVQLYERKNFTKIQCKIDTANSIVAEHLKQNFFDKIEQEITEYHKAQKNGQPNTKYPSIDEELQTFAENTKIDINRAYTDKRVSKLIIGELSASLSDNTADAVSRAETFSTKLNEYAAKGFELPPTKESADMALNYLEAFTSSASTKLPDKAVIAAIRNLVTNSNMFDPHNLANYMRNSVKNNNTLNNETLPNVMLCQLSQIRKAGSLDKVDNKQLNQLGSCVKTLKSIGMDLPYSSPDTIQELVRSAKIHETQTKDIQDSFVKHGIIDNLDADAMFERVSRALVDSKHANNSFSPPPYSPSSILSDSVCKMRVADRNRMNFWVDKGGLNVEAFESAKQEAIQKITGSVLCCSCNTDEENCKLYQFYDSVLDVGNLAQEKFLHSDTLQTPYTYLYYRLSPKEKAYLDLERNAWKFERKAGENTGGATTGPNPEVSTVGIITDNDRDRLNTTPGRSFFNARRDKAKDYFNSDGTSTPELASDMFKYGLWEPILNLAKDRDPNIIKNLSTEQRSAIDTAMTVKDPWLRTYFARFNAQHDTNLEQLATAANYVNSQDRLLLGMDFKQRPGLIRLIVEGRNKIVGDDTIKSLAKYDSGGDEILANMSDAEISQTIQQFNDISQLPTVFKDKSELLARFLRCQKSAGSKELFKSVADNINTLSDQAIGNLQLVLACQNRFNIHNIDELDNYSQIVASKLESDLESDDSKRICTAYEYILDPLESIRPHTFNPHELPVDEMVDLLNKGILNTTDVKFIQIRKALNASHLTAREANAQLATKYSAEELALLSLRQKLNMHIAENYDAFNSIAFHTNPKITEESINKALAPDNFMVLSNVAEKIEQYYTKNWNDALLDLDAEVPGMDHMTLESGCKVVKLHGAKFAILSHNTGVSLSPISRDHNRDVDPTSNKLQDAAAKDPDALNYSYGLSTISTSLITDNCDRSINTAYYIILGFTDIPDGGLLGMCHSDARTTHGQGRLSPSMMSKLESFEDFAHIEETGGGAEVYNEVALYRYISTENGADRTQPTCVIQYGGERINKNIERVATQMNLPVLWVDINTYYKNKES